MLYGFDIGGTKIEFSVFNEKLEKQYSQRIITPQDTYENWLSSISMLVKEADKIFDCTGSVGLGIPGFINRETNLSEISNIRIANNRPIERDLSERLERKIKIENDANCFALSEANSPDIINFPSILGVILGTGFGGGLILNKKIISGINGVAGELGHIKLNYHCLKLLGWNKAPIYKCGCGSEGCLDSYLSGRGFEMLYRDFTGVQLSAKEIIKRFYLHFQEIEEFVFNFIELLACSIADIINILDPSVIILGGGLSNFDFLYQELPNILSKYLLKNVRVPIIRKAKYGDSSGVRGAAALWLN